MGGRRLEVEEQVDSTWILVLLAGAGGGGGQIGGTPTSGGPVTSRPPCRRRHRRWLRCLLEGRQRGGAGGLGRLGRRRQWLVMTLLVLPPIGPALVRRGASGGGTTGATTATLTTAALVGVAALRFRVTGSGFALRAAILALLAGGSPLGRLLLLAQQGQGYGRGWCHRHRHHTPLLGLKRWLCCSTTTWYGIYGVLPSGIRSCGGCGGGGGVRFAGIVYGGAGSLLFPHHPHHLPHPTTGHHL